MTATRSHVDAADAVLAPAAARSLARLLLRQLPRRWTHVQAVGHSATRLAPRLALPASEQQTLVAAAWLHDIGYSAALPAPYGWHPLDGAAFLRTLGFERLAGLVAHHTTADQESVLLGHAAALSGFPAENTLISSALSYLDMTNGPDGQRWTFAQRFADVQQRYGDDSTPTRAMREAMPHLLNVHAQVHAALI